MTSARSSSFSSSLLCRSALRRLRPAHRASVSWRARLTSSCCCWASTASASRPRRALRAVAALNSASSSWREDRGGDRRDRHGDRQDRHGDRQPRPRRALRAVAALNSASSSWREDRGGDRQDRHGADRADTVTHSLGLEATARLEGRGHAELSVLQLERGQRW